MTAKQKKLFLLTSVMSVFVMAVAVVFTGGKFKLSPLSVRGSGETINGSITWTKDSAKTSHGSGGYNKSFYETTGRGTGVYLYSENYYSLPSNLIFDGKASNDNYGLYVSSEAGSKSSLFAFQNITSVSFVTGSLTAKEAHNGVKIYTRGLDNSPYILEGLNTLTTYTLTTEISGGTSLVIKPYASAYEVDIVSLTIEFSCTPGAPSVKTLSSISLDTTNVETEFTVGDTFNYSGLVVTAHYSDSSTATVSPTSVTSPDMSSAGEKTITVSYTESGVTRTASYSIAISSVDPGALIIEGKYNYSSRSVGSTSYVGKMTIEFYSNGTVMWRLQRESIFGNAFDCKVYFNYVATDNTTNITLEMTHTSYDFKKDGVSSYGPNDWSGGNYDKPIAGSFGNTSATNNTGVLTNNRNTLTIGIYSNGSQDGTFTFTKAAS